MGRNAELCPRRKRRMEKKEEWPCLVCGEPYRNSRPGEKWVQCFDCKHWSHEECTPGDAYYVCQNCESDDDL